MWTNIPNNSPWRSWKSTHQEIQVATDCDLQHWRQATIPRRIWISIYPNIIRWGHTAHGNLTLKEGYSKGKFSDSAKIPHLDNSMKIEILAQNLHVSLVPSSKQDLNCNVPPTNLRLESTTPKKPLML